MVKEPPKSATFLTVGEVADYMRLSRMTVYRMIERGEMPALRVGRSFRVPRVAIEQIVSQTMSEWEQISGTDS